VTFESKAISRFTYTSHCVYLVTYVLNEDNIVAYFRLHIPQSASISCT